MHIVANTAFVLGAGVTPLEWFTLPPAVLMIAVCLLGWRGQSSWVFLEPGLLLGLVPSALIANSNDGALRLALVLASAVAITLVGVRFSLQAPFVLGAAVLAKVGVWQCLQVAPMIPAGSPSAWPEQSSSASAPATNAACKKPNKPPAG
jgi:hypothetical protein